MEHVRTMGKENDMEEEQNARNIDEETAEPVTGTEEAGRPDDTEADDAKEELLRELDDARAKLEQLERERFLLLQGVPEEDLDYCVFRIGKMVSDGKDFRAAAKEFLKRHETGAGGPGFRTGASLSGRGPKAPPTANETMNMLLRAGR